MNKFLILMSFMLFFLIGCGGPAAKNEENNEPINTDYFYEMNNKFIDSGHNNMKQGLNKEAVADFTKAIEELPNYAYAYGFRATAKKNIGDLEGAMDDINKAIELKNDTSDFYFWRSEIYKEMGDEAAKNKDLEKVEQLKHNFK